MGNALPYLADTFRRETRWLLQARDMARPWQYPRQNFQMVKTLAAQVMATLLESMAYRIRHIWWHMEDIGWHLWRILYHLLKLADDMVISMLNLWDAFLVVILEVLQRTSETVSGRARRRMLSPEFR